MARTKNNFLNAKPVSKMGGGSGGVRKPSKPYSKPPAGKKVTPKLTPKASKPAPKPAAPTVKGPVPRPGLQNRGVRTTRDLLPNSDRRGGNLPKAGAQALRSRTQGPKAPTTTKTTQVVTKPVTRTGPVKGPVPPKGSSPVTMPNSRRAGVNLPQTGARAERTATRVADLKKASTPKPNASAGTSAAVRGAAAGGARGLVRGAGKLLGRVALPAAIAQQAKDVLNPKDNIITRGAALGRSIERVVGGGGGGNATPAQRAAKLKAQQNAKPSKPPLSSTGVRTNSGNTVRTGSPEYNRYRQQQLDDNKRRNASVRDTTPSRQSTPSSGGGNSSPNRSSGGGNNAPRTSASRSQTPPTPRFTGTADEGRKMWAEKYSSSKYEGQAIQKEAKKLLDEMKKRKEDKSNATKAGWDGNKNY